MLVVFKQIKPLYFFTLQFCFVFLFVKLKACTGERPATRLSIVKKPTTKTQTKPQNL